MDKSVDKFEQDKRFLSAFFRNFKKHLFFVDSQHPLSPFSMFPNDLDISRQVRNLKKTTKLLSLKNMFRQKPLSSSVN